VLSAIEMLHESALYKFTTDIDMDNDVKTKTEFTRIGVSGLVVRVSDS